MTFLHNELFFAAAQKKYVYIYDKRGLEVHCLREHVEPAALEFLPHHFLLASVGEPGACLSLFVAVCCCFCCRLLPFVDKISRRGGTCQLGHNPAVCSSA